jgi:hypothetical protein
LEGGVCRCATYRRGGNPPGAPSPIPRTQPGAITGNVLHIVTPGNSHTRIHATALDNNARAPVTRRVVRECYRGGFQSGYVGPTFNFNAGIGEL